MSEIEIGQRSVIQDNWEHNAPVNDRLRRVLEPLAVHFNQEITDELEDADQERRMEMIKEAGNPYILPYGRIGMLPPAIFGDIGENNITLQRELVVPESDLAIRSLIDGYFRWTKRLGDSGKYTYSETPLAHYLKGKMNALKGMRYPSDKWWMSASAMQEALRKEPIFVMDAHRGNRIGNAALDHDELNEATRAVHAQHDKYTLVMSTRESRDQMMAGTRDYAQLPVGEYGEKAANKLAGLVVALNNYIKGSFMIDAGVHNRMTPDDKELLAEYTARSREKREIGVKEFAIHGAKHTLAEGVLSIAQVIALLTAEEVAGYEDHDQLVSAILDSDIIEQFTRLVPPGYIGPSTLSGIYMPGALVMRDGKPVLSKEVIKVLSGMRKSYLAAMAAMWATYRATDGASERPLALGLVCPGAGHNGAITMAKRAFKPFYKQS